MLDMVWARFRRLFFITCCIIFTKMRKKSMSFLPKAYPANVVCPLAPADFKPYFLRGTRESIARPRDFSVLSFWAKRRISPFQEVLDHSLRSGWQEIGFPTASMVLHGAFTSGKLVCKLSSSARFDGLTAKMLIIEVFARPQALRFVILSEAKNLVFQ